MIKRQNTTFLLAIFETLSTEQPFSQDFLQKLKTKINQSIPMSMFAAAAAADHSLHTLISYLLFTFLLYVFSRH